MISIRATSTGAKEAFYIEILQVCIRLRFGRVLGVLVPKHREKNLFKDFSTIFISYKTIVAHLLVGP